VIAALLDHLWQSSLVALLAAALTLTVRRNGARVRFWLWFSASIKFLLPFAALAALGGWLSRLYPLALAAPLALQPALRLTAPSRMLPVSQESLNLEQWLLMAWAVGLAAVLGLRLLRWLRLRALLADAQPLAGQALRIKTSSSLLELGLVGILRPVVMLPSGLLAQLAPGELAAILAHEASHLARRDNLSAAIHMLVEALFWFWPPVWLIGARLIAERERACDESVIALGHDPLVYGQGILKACRFCLPSPLACVAGVSGSDLRRRMERIMAADAAQGMDAARGALLVGAALTVVALPVLAGFVTSPLAVEMSHRAAHMQARLQQAMSEPFSLLAPQDRNLVPVARSPRRPRAHAAKHLAPPEPPVPAAGDTMIAAPIPAPTPLVVTAIVPAIQTAASDSVVAIAPTGAGDPEAVTCRLPQPLPGSRLPGPEVCKTNRIWSTLRAQGVQIAADGRTIYVVDDYQRRRALSGCQIAGAVGGGSTSMLTGMQSSICS
jgi:beta-lactamase regulating signal transducer with metallopeptidase domain